MYLTAMRRELFPRLSRISSISGQGLICRPTSQSGLNYLLNFPLQLIDCYMEAYHHVFDRDEKRAIAQVVMNIIYQRPRFDLTADYFVKMYRAECVILRQHVNLIKGILDKQVLYCQN